MRRLLLDATAVALLAAPLSATAQAPALVTVVGVAFDSVRAQPVANAFVSTAGRSAATDANGVFRIDSVVTGSHTIALQHESLDSIGLSGITVKVVVTDGRDTIRIAVPSFASLWRVVCGRPAPALDSGVVFGVIRDVARQAPVSGALVSASWLDLTVGAAGAFNQKRWRLTATADAQGSYALCGLPVDVVAQIRAATDSASSGSIDQVVPTSLRIQRRDLSLSDVGAVATARGTIAGTVTTEAGRPVRDARILVTDVPEVRTDADGRFTLREVKTGTQQVEALSLGMLPATIAVDVRSNATTEVALVLLKGHTLDTVKVNATSVRRNMIADIEDRRKTGFGHFIDSTRVNQAARLLTVFEELPSTRVQAGAIYFNGCKAKLWVDGIQVVDVAIELALQKATDIAQIEVYPRASTVPIKFQGKLGRACGAVVIWNKRYILP